MRHRRHSRATALTSQCLSLPALAAGDFHALSLCAQAIGNLRYSSQLLGGAAMPSRFIVVSSPINDTLAPGLEHLLNTASSVWSNATTLLWSSGASERLVSVALRMSSIVPAVCVCLSLILLLVRFVVVRVQARMLIYTHAHVKCA